MAFQLKRKNRKFETGFTKGFAWKAQRDKRKRTNKQFEFLLPFCSTVTQHFGINKWFELLLYGFTSFQPKENPKVWNCEGKESDTIWNHENLPIFLLYGFTVTATYLTSFLLVFLSSQYINSNKTWLIQLRYL